MPEQRAVQRDVAAAEKNYVIQKNDYLELEVYTNDGERIIDPDFKIQSDNQAGSQTNTQQKQETPKYLVDINGVIRFPMIGELKLEGLTLRQAQEILQKEYTKFYEHTFVVLRYSNKRVIILGSPGGQVIPLTNENTTLVEVLALAKGVGNDAKAHNIRVLRGDQVFVADFSTFDGYLKHNMIIEPGDVVYVEPVRRPLLEALRDYGPIISFFTSLATIAIVLTQL